MPTYRINVINQHFRSSNDQELANAEDARDAAIMGALQIGAGEVCMDRPFFGAEVSIDENGERLGRYIVSIGISSLK